MKFRDSAPISELVARLGRNLGSLSGPGVAEVMARFTRHAAGRVDAVTPSTNAVIEAHLSTAIAAMPDRDLASAIQAAAPWLPWTTFDRYNELIGEAFASSHALVRLIGEGAPITANDFEVGLFLLQPRVFYRDHEHAAPELYVPLTGPHGWRFAPGDPLVPKPAGETIWNPPFRPHAIKVGDVPFLSYYVWTSDVKEPSCVIPAADWEEMEC